MLNNIFCKGAVTGCNFSSNLQCNSDLRRCYLKETEKVFYKVTILMAECPLDSNFNVHAGLEFLAIYLLRAKSTSKPVSLTVSLCNLLLSKLYCL